METSSPSYLMSFLVFPFSGFLFAALDDDDSDLLDLLAKNGDQLHVNNPLSGSEVKSSSFQSHSKEGKVTVVWRFLQ